jgi:signal transduction histidine kinase
MSDINRPRTRFTIGAKFLLITSLLSICPLLLIYHQISVQLEKMQTYLAYDAENYALNLQKVDGKTDEEQASEYGEAIEREFEYAALRLLMTMLILVVAVSLVLMILARYFSHRLTKQLEILEEGIKDWDGATPTAVLVEGSDEIAVLAMQFSLMTEKVARLIAEAEERKQALEKADNELMRFTISLEEQIDKRTKRLRKALDDLRTLDKAKDEFLSLVTHELKTPLTSITACAEVLTGEVQLPEQTRKKFTRIIRDESERLTRLINEVLDYSRLSAGSLPIHFRQVNLIRLLERSVLQHLPAADKEKILLKFIQPDPADPRLQSVRADPDRIQQVMTNLLSNALKFTSSGGSVSVSVETLVKTSSGRKSDFAEVRVSDTGIGIAPQDREKVFERFAQAGKMEHHSEGTGLGLPIAQGIVQEHGGKIWFTSNPGKGTSFYFTLPLVDSKAEDGRENRGNGTEE